MMKLQKSVALLLCGILCMGTMSGCGTKEKDAKVSATDAPKETSIPEITKAPASNGMVINCWGDSLTAGTAHGNKLSYPAALQKSLSDYTVNNFGIGGESSKTIAQRMGASPLAVGTTEGEKKEEFTISANSGDSVYFSVLGDDTYDSKVLGQVQEDTKQDCLNPVIINGVEGTLSKRGFFYCFTPSNSKEDISLKQGDIIFPQASFGNYSNDINIIWAGTNDYAKPENVSSTIENIQAMLDYLGSDRYIIVGLTALSYMPEVAKVNEALSEAFGEHFYDFRSYILEEGLQDAGIKPTKADKADLKKGEIPASFMKAPDPDSDHVHGNEAFYQLLANELKKKLEELQYI